MAPLLDRVVDRIPIPALQNSPVGWLQVICYVIIVAVSMCVAIPIGLTLRNFEGMCILFAQVVWDNEVIYPWSEPSCDFVMYSTIALGIIYATLMALFTGVAIWPTVPNNQYKKLGVISKGNAKYVLHNLTAVLVFINFIIMMLMLCSACVLTAGFIMFCDFLEESMTDLGVPGTCASGQDLDWNKFRVLWGPFGGIDGHNYHTCMTVATIASWLLVGLWIMQIVLGCGMCCRRCSCEIAEEKRKPDKATWIAQRRSRMATPIGTPGGLHTPVPMGQPMPGVGFQQQPPQQQQRRYAPAQSRPGPGQYQGQQPAYSMPPPQQGYQPPPQGFHPGVSLPQKGGSESTA